MVQGIRLLIACVLALAWAVPASAQPTLVGQVTTSSCTGVSSCASASGVSASAGDLGVVLIGTRSSGTVITSVTGAGSGWTCPADASIVDSGVRGASLCYNLSLGGGTITPTAVLSGTESGAIFMSFSVYRPPSSEAWQYDDGAEAVDATSPFSGGDVTTAGPGVLINVAAQNGSAVDETPETNWTQLTPIGSREYWSYRLASAGVTDDGSWTSASDISTAIAVAGFSYAGGGGGGTGCPGMLLRGVCD